MTKIVLPLFQNKYNTHSLKNVMDYTNFFYKNPFFGQSLVLRILTVLRENGAYFSS